MNKQELIERIEGLKNIFWDKCEYVKIDFMIELVSKLDEPQKVTIPQFVADYIKDAKYYEWDLDDVFDHIAEESGSSEISEWLYTIGNVDVFARAWLDGYEVEKEKRYTVKIKGELEENLLVYGLGVKKFFFTRFYDSSKKGKHTRKELEEAGFGWVFDCPGVEVEEVI